jgi:hypothetical protein
MGDIENQIYSCSSMVNNQKTSHTMVWPARAQLQIHIVYNCDMANDQGHITHTPTWSACRSPSPQSSDFPRSPPTITTQCWGN